MMLSAGVLAGEYAHLTLTAEELYAALEDFPVILEDSLPTSRHPLRPRGLLTMNAKQLSSYGGSLETAVTDLEHLLWQHRMDSNLGRGTNNLIITP